MNTLLGFNPEPFETDSEIAGALHGVSPFSHGSPVAPLSAREWEAGAYVRPRRRTGPRPTLPFQPAPSPPRPFDSQAFRQKIVRIANQELARWGNGAIKETNPRVRRVLQDYWKTGVGRNVSDAQLADSTFHEKNPWSAAFISWVMRTAGAGKAFKYNSYHSTYTRAAIDNRLANNDNPFKAYRITELAPRVGDLICKRRAGSGASYDNIRPGMKTHCDLVTEVRPGSLLTIGGNVDNSVAHPKKPPRTDASGRIAEPNYFAVIRIDGKQPSVPPAPPPTPSVGSAPRLIKQESIPTGSTLYVEIDLKLIDKFGITAPPVTGIFIPDGYAAGATVDLILYLHGFKADAIKRQAIDQYWNSKRFPYGALREGVNASARNVILVAPTLGSRSEAKRLLEPGGLDAFIAQVLMALHTHGPHRRTRSAPTLGNLIFACHSGGGWPMRQLAGGSDRALAHLRECWGYDCTYNKGDDVFWTGWARARPNARVYIYYIAGSPTARLAESLRDKRVPNAIVQPSRDRRHNYVPITHWKERMQGAPFLAMRSGGAIQPPPSPAAPAPVVAAGPVDQIKRIAAASNIARYHWKHRGVAPPGYIKGMALVYARVYCKLKAGDAAAVEMAKAKTTDPLRDALAWYNDIFTAAAMSNDTAGADTLRHLFVLLIGLGMRESSGKYCEGRDRSAKNITADTAEAGLFQTSFNARHASSLLPMLFARYAATCSGFVDVFKEGVHCSASDLENFGSGDGRKFQRLSKECPAFAAEFAAVALRHVRKHWGPINRRAAEVRPECDAMLRQVQVIVDASPGICAALA